MESRQIEVCERCRQTATQLDTPIKVCGGCRNAYYCGRVCQKQHWWHHRKHCDSIWRCAYAESDVPEGVRVEEGVMDERSKWQLNEKRISKEQANQSIVVVVPTNPLAYNYMRWHAQQKKRKV